MSCHQLRQLNTPNTGRKSKQPGVLGFIDIAKRRTASDDRAREVIGSCGDVVVPVQELHRPWGYNGVSDHAVGKLDAIGE